MTFSQWLSWVPVALPLIVAASVLSLVVARWRTTRTVVWSALGLVGGNGLYIAIWHLLSNESTSPIMSLLAGAGMSVPTMGVIGIAATIGVQKHLGSTWIALLGLVGGLVAVPANMLAGLVVWCGLGGECI